MTTPAEHKDRDIMDKARHQDVEVFYLSKLDVWYNIHNFGDDANLSEIGYYWWSCFPGCLPDSEPFGPFETEAEALADAQDIG